MQTLFRNWHAPRLCSHATMCSCSLSVLSPKTVLGGLNSHYNNDNDTLINSAVLSLLSQQCVQHYLQVLFLSSSSVSELWLLPICKIRSCRPKNISWTYIVFDRDLKVRKQGWLVYTSCPGYQGYYNLNRNTKTNSVVTSLFTFWCSVVCCKTSIYPSDVNCSRNMSGKL